MLEYQHMDTKILELLYKMIIEEDEDGYFVASVPELPGCHTQGKSLKQVRSRIKEAIHLYLTVHKDYLKDKIKTPGSLVNFFGIEDIKIRYAQT